MQVPPAVTGLHPRQAGSFLFILYWWPTVPCKSCIPNLAGFHLTKGLTHNDLRQQLNQLPLGIITLTDAQLSVANRNIEP
jgi:hypothetical protein